MAIHASTLAWKIPWTEEPGRLQSMRSLRVRYDWASSLSLFTFMHWRRKWQPIPVFLPGESQGRGSLVGCHLWGRTELDMMKRFSSSSCAECPLPPMLTFQMVFSEGEEMSRLYPSNGIAWFPRGSGRLPRDPTGKNSASSGFYIVPSLVFSLPYKLRFLTENFVVQSLSRVQLFPWAAACQASLFHKTLKKKSLKTTVLEKETDRLLVLWAAPPWRILWSNEHGKLNSL